MQIREPAPDTHPLLLQLPEECLREVVLRLSDHGDLAAASKACDQLAVLVDEQRVWNELVRFHFSPQQIDVVVKDVQNVDWKETYQALKRYVTPFVFEHLTSKFVDSDHLDCVKTDNMPRLCPSAGIAGACSGVLWAIPALQTSVRNTANVCKRPEVFFLHVRCRHRPSSSSSRCSCCLMCCRVPSPVTL